MNENEGLGSFSFSLGPVLLLSIWLHTAQLSEGSGISRTWRHCDPSWREDGTQAGARRGPPASRGRCGERPLRRRASLAAARLSRRRTRPLTPRRRALRTRRRGWRGRRRRSRASAERAQPALSAAHGRVGRAGRVSGAPRGRAGGWGRGPGRAHPRGPRTRGRGPAPRRVGAGGPSDPRRWLPRPPPPPFTCLGSPGPRTPPPVLPSPHLSLSLRDPRTFFSPWSRLEKVARLPDPGSRPGPPVAQHPCAPPRPTAPGGEELLRSRTAEPHERVPLKDEGFARAAAGGHDSGITSVRALSTPVLALVSSHLAFFEQLLSPRLCVINGRCEINGVLSLLSRGTAIKPLSGLIRGTGVGFGKASRRE